MIESTFTVTLNKKIDKRELDRISKIFKKFNKKYGVTGQLIVCEQKIICLVEGKEARVIELFFNAQINNDFREVKFTGKWPIAVRQFKTIEILYDVDSLAPNAKKTNFFENNLKYLMLLVEKNSCGTVKFWNNVESLLIDMGSIEYAYNTNTVDTPFYFSEKRAS